MRRHLGWWLILVTATLLPRLVAACHAAAPARDAIRYVAAARTLRDQPWPEAARAIDCHPLYPTCLGLAEATFGPWLGSTPAERWWRAGQVLGIVSSLLLVTAAYRLGVAFVPPIVAATGTAVAALMPRQIAYSVDVLTDPLHAALWLGTLAVIAGAATPANAKTPWTTAASFATGGLLAGLACWTRPEGYGLLLAVPCGTAAWLLLDRGTREFPATGRVAGPAAFLVVAGTMAGGYVATIGGISPRSTATVLLAATPMSPPAASPSADVEPPATTQGRVGNAVVDLATIEPGQSRKRASLAAAVLKAAEELLQESHVWPTLLACLGVATLATRRRLPPAALPVLAAAGSITVLMVVLPMRAGYVSGRYLSPVLPLVGILAVVGAEAWWPRVLRAVRLTSNRPCVPWANPATLPALLLTLAAVLAVPTLLTPLHRYRDGQRVAAAWLAAHSRPGDRIIDPTGFVSFFADRPTWTVADGLGTSRTPAFAIVDPSVAPDVPPLWRTILQNCMRDGRLVASFPKHAGSTEVAVYVYSLRDPATAVSARPAPETTR